MIRVIPVLDTETTGLHPAEGATVVEVAWVVLALPMPDDKPEDQCEWMIATHFSTMIEHDGDIPPEARAVHHISPEQVAPGTPGVMRREAIVQDLLGAEVSGEMCYAAHNSPFDKSMLPELTLPWIDTLQCARHIWQDAPSYGNQVLRYWLGLEPNPALMIGSDGLPLAPHRALYDAAVTTEVLRLMLNDHTPEKLIELSSQPILLQKCHLKKYKDVPWDKVPRDYLRWIKTTDMLSDNINLAHTVNYYYNL